ncbi:MAG TPA: hypothetical protein VGT41_05020 [Candidatus Babeliales bacterium]|nr:hypothetical protein [Candidatus Babeliales bacterium]
MMNWKTNLLKFERDQQWDDAIEYMQNIIAENPYDMDAAIYMNYLLMNLIVEEAFDMEKFEYYQFLTKKYFKKSYENFSDNPEYLFFTGITASMSPWFFDMESEEPEKLLQEAVELNKDNILYHWGYHPGVKTESPMGRQLAQSILNDYRAMIQLRSKGALGEYIYQMIMSCGQSNKRQLCWILDMYLNPTTITKTMSDLCYSCYRRYAHGLQDDVLSQEEERLFVKFMNCVKSFVKNEKAIGDYPKFYFPENEFKQVASQLRKVLENDLEN